MVELGTTWRGVATRMTAGGIGSLGPSGSVFEFFFEIIQLILLCFMISVKYFIIRPFREKKMLFTIRNTVTVLLLLLFTIDIPRIERT